MFILGLNAYHGDSAACLVREGQLIVAAEEERFRRVKHWAGLPTEADREVQFQAAAAEAPFPLAEPLLLHKAVHNRVVRDYNGGQPLGLKLSTYSDAPAGSGLGASSTLVVCMLRAYAEWLNRICQDEYPGRSTQNSALGTGESGQAFLVSDDPGLQSTGGLPGGGPAERPRTVSPVRTRCRLRSWGSRPGRLDSGKQSGYST